MTRRTFVLIGIFLGGLFANSLHAQQGDTTFAIDSDNSTLRVYVGRAGPLARMGHNHVVHSNGLTGVINLASDLEESSASFELPLSSFIVDEQSERDRAAADQREGFDTQPGRRAIEGTRRNMMSEDVLNEELFPTISANISTVSVLEEQWRFNIALNISGNTVELELPAEVNVSEGNINVSASFSLQHEDLGLSVFTALGGSLRVAERLDFELEIQGVAE